MGRRTRGVEVEKWGVMVCLCVHRGTGGTHTLNTTGYHGGGPLLIRIPLMPVGNLLDRHALSTHTQTHSGGWLTTPTPLCSSLLLLENGHNGCRRVLASDEAQNEVLTSARWIDITTGDKATENIQS